ncbi:MAG: hypothetical protein JW809_06515 [Pirellulales bacterium]|nr:hypothetical protein [Pirellulales bacterium]
MNSFPVWLRPLGETCRVRVDGVQNAQWLLNRLGLSFVFKTAAPITEDADSTNCTFCVAYSSHMSRRELEKVLAMIPEVSVMMDPA